MTYRNTFVNINLENIKNNVKTIINTYNDYKYYFGVVKADSYGHYTNKVVKAIIEGGCNYLAVSSLDEALIIRKDFDIPILCLGIINPKHLNICEKNNIDVTVTSLDYLKEAKNYNLNIHLKLDTGMNRLGIKEKDELNDIYKEIKNSNLTLMGIFTHIYKANDKKEIDKQIEKFKYLTKEINLNDIPIVHIAQSDTLSNYEKIPFCNGCRLGIIMYGLTGNLDLKDTFSLCSEIIEIKKIRKGETVSYNGTYTALDDEIIGIVSIGYADGINRKMTGSYVYINNKKYQIIGTICMDMLMVKIDDSVKINDVVYIYKDINHLQYISKYLNTIPYELICGVSKRVPRKYVK